MKSWLTSLLLTAVVSLSWAGDSDWLEKIGKNTTSAVEDKPNISLQLIAESDGLTPQAENRLAIIIDHHDGWHTYWRMPGDTGIPTTFSFTKPHDIRLTEPAFPLPERIQTADMISYGYSARTILPFEVQVPRFPAGHSATIGAHVEYLACKTVCVPGQADLQIELPYRPAAKPTPEAELIQKAVSLLPEKLDTHHITATVDNQYLQISIPPSEVKVRQQLDFFPLDADILKYNEKPVFRHASDGSAQLVMALSASFASGKHRPDSLHGILSGDGGPQAGGWAIETAIPLRAGKIGAETAHGLQDFSLPVPDVTVSVGTLSALLFAFIGGLILNLMPCVFPILSLKLLDLLKGYTSGKPMLPHGIAFTAGVLLSMTLLTSILLLFRAFGTSLGWGFQFKTPGSSPSWFCSLLPLPLISSAFLNSRPAVIWLTRV
ncbi:thiol:disulfide interchange protein DsbD [gut metagenome]|uniref:Thiol:disulfide interchange protein DsbD n=1 Tax=gut metagenome TaxID=749906 RepID=J9H5A5_9ZZZZ